MKAGFAIAALTAACLSTFAAAQMGPGMMQGQGMGMGPGMMQGQGMGPGMGMLHGQGMGPGMMQGRGPGGGMMGRHGMMGHDAMGGMGLARIEALNLTDEQRTKVTAIRRDLQRRNHALMGSMLEVRWKGQDLAKAPRLDTAAARKLYDEGAAVHKQMFEARLDARAKAEALLTPEQLEQLHQHTRRGPPWSVPQK